MSLVLRGMGAANALVTGGLGQAAESGAEGEIRPSGIPAGTVFGVPRLDLNVTGTSIASAEAFGGARLDFIVEVVGAYPGSIGEHSVEQVTQVTGIASAGAFGTPRVDYEIAAGGLGAEAFGAPRLDLNITAAAASSSEAWGQPDVQKVLGADAIGSSELFGTARLDLSIDFTGLPDPNAWGDPRLDLNITIGGIASAEAFGIPDRVQPLDPTGVASLEAFGTARLDLSITAGDITSTAWGDARLDYNANPDAIGSAEALGTPDIRPLLGPSGITSAEQWGLPRLDLGIQTSTLPDDFGIGVARLDLNIQSGSVGSNEALGSNSVEYVVDAGSAGAGGALGAPALTTGPVDVTTVGIASGEQAGAPRLDLTLDLSALSVGELVGSPTLELFVSVTGAASAEAVAAPTVLPGSVDISPLGVASGEAVSDADVRLEYQVQGIGSDELWGTPDVQPGYVDVTASGFIAGVAGTPTVIREFVPSTLAAPLAYRYLTVPPDPPLPPGAPNYKIEWATVTQVEQGIKIKGGTADFTQLPDGTRVYRVPERFIFRFQVNNQGHYVVVGQPVRFFYFSTAAAVSPQASWRALG